MIRKKIFIFILVFYFFNACSGSNSGNSSNASNSYSSYTPDYADCMVSNLSYIKLCNMYKDGLNINYDITSLARVDLRNVYIEFICYDDEENLVNTTNASISILRPKEKSSWVRENFSSLYQSNRCISITITVTDFYI